MRVINHLTMFSGNQLADIFCVILKQLFVAEQNLRAFLRRVRRQAENAAAAAFTASETVDWLARPTFSVTSPEAGLKTS